MPVSERCVCPVRQPGLEGRFRTDGFFSGAANRPALARAQKLHPAGDVVRRRAPLNDGWLVCACVRLQSLATSAPLTGTGPSTRAVCWPSASRAGKSAPPPPKQVSPDCPGTHRRSAIRELNRTLCAGPGLGESAYREDKPKRAERNACFSVFERLYAVRGNTQPARPPACCLLPAACFRCRKTELWPGHLSPV
eukprot:COSAG01_NODE_12423_length_1742_cov_1.653682_1_plen_194_part_00